LREHKSPRTTRPAAETSRSVDLVERDFTVSRANELWVADLTYVRTAAGWVYAAFVLDVLARMIVGWQVAINLYTDLALNALQTARRQGTVVAGVPPPSVATRTMGSPWPPPSTRGRPWSWALTPHDCCGRVRRMARRSARPRSRVRSCHGTTNPVRTSTVRNRGDMTTATELQYPTWLMSAAVTNPNHPSLTTARPTGHNRPTSRRDVKCGHNTRTFAVTSQALAQVLWSGNGRSR
jgi:hypothetical protein